MQEELIKKIGLNLEHDVLVIAEIGSNHDGDLNRAKRLMEYAAECGADVVKFQSFTAEGLLNPTYIKDGLCFEHPGYRILQQMAVPADWYPELVNHAKNIGVVFLSTPFDLEQVKLLEQMHVPCYKIASGDITNYLFLSHVADFQKPIILSTGLAYLSEVGRAVETIEKKGNKNVILLHCVSLYPPDFSAVNLKAMITMRQAFQLPVGISDHTPGDAVPLAAVAMGACVLEKHLTDDKNRNGPDHPFAMDGHEFSAMVKKIRQLEVALGDGVKKPTRAEQDERFFSFRSVHAKVKINKGENIENRLIKIVRPADGIPAEFAQMIIGRVVKEDIEKNEPITWDKLL